MTATLNLLTWPGYVSPATLEAFALETGITVELDAVSSVDEIVARLRRGEPPLDLLVRPDYAVRQLAGEGLLLPLDPTLLPNLAHLEPRFRRGRPHDPDSRLSVPKDWGTTGYLYRTDRVAGSPQTWGDFWDLAASPAHSGRVSVLDSSGEVIGAALKRRGRSYNDSSPQGLAQARDDLLALRPHLRVFETDYKPLLARGEVDLALGWNGDAVALGASDVPVRCVLPTEGSQIWEDDWAIRLTRVTRAKRIDSLISSFAPGSRRRRRYAPGTPPRTTPPGRSLPPRCATILRSTPHRRSSGPSSPACPSIRPPRCGGNSCGTRFGGPLPVETTDWGGLS